MGEGRRGEKQYFSPSLHETHRRQHPCITRSYQWRNGVLCPLLSCSDFRSSKGWHDGWTNGCWEIKWGELIEPKWSFLTGPFWTFLIGCGVRVSLALITSCDGVRHVSWTMRFCSGWGHRSLVCGSRRSQIIAFWVWWYNFCYLIKISVGFIWHWVCCTVCVMCVQLWSLYGEFFC